MLRIRRSETIDGTDLPFSQAAQAARITRYTRDAVTGLPVAKEVAHIITSLPRALAALRLAG